MTASTKPIQVYDGDGLKRALGEMSEEMAAQIDALHAALLTLANSRLSKKLIVLMLHDMTNIGKRDIERLLDALVHLKPEYLKKA